MSQEQYMRPLEVARLLKLNVETVYHYIKIGKLPAARLGRRYVVARSDLDAFLEMKKGVDKVSKLGLSEKGESMVGTVVKSAGRVRVFLEEYPGAANEEIAGALDIEPADTQRALRKLEAQKLVYCEAAEGDPDRLKDPWYLVA